MLKHNVRHAQLAENTPHFGPSRSSADYIFTEDLIMARIESLDKIGEIVVHWSESKYINNILDPLGDGDIEKAVDVFAFNSIVTRASALVDIGYDKTSLSVKLKDGTQWCSECKFNLTKSKNTLLKLLNAGE